ncbi:phenylacetate--CoA ligase family protein [Treponema brennaborense]|uniref:Phenylacetate-coenzyme A ligase n=1 Tax=Treponema brennaborense (strain DSM 12168 / CIP 105900 / DD5/3) TaxID=906968 RepID=F4LJM2_TREBD|nr:phenylacetate--CoA ligase [Treponema brennaborense]AEE17402.1 Phenylacetate--CoA ligase [Treponema brennaborense DSM 12168]
MNREIPFWDKKNETMSREDLRALQLERLRVQVDHALRTSFYKDRLRAAGVTGAQSIKSLDDLRRLPFTTKTDLREAYPFGMLAVPKDELVRIHASSGTTGTPTVIYLTQRDLDMASDTMARSLAAAGCTKSDTCQNMMTYGLFTGGLGFHYGAERLGMTMIPTGSGNTLRQIKFMKDFGTTVTHATPSYLLHLHAAIEESGFARSDFAWRLAVTGAEPHSEELRCKIQDKLGIEVYNCYGMSELNGPGTAFECVFRQGMHVWEDRYIMEIIDPDTLEPVPDGEIGELVMTILHRDAMPLLRYRTRDLTRVVTEPCPCGRTHRRIARFTGRTDDMLIINGVNVFPSQIEEVLLKMHGVGANYLIIVEKHGVLDRLIVQTEVTPEMFADDARVLNALRDKIKAELSALITINPAVELKEPGSMPVAEGKAKRVEDRRKNECR